VSGQTDGVVAHPLNITPAHAISRQFLHIFRKERGAGLEFGIAVFMVPPVKITVLKIGSSWVSVKLESQDRFGLIDPACDEIAILADQLIN